jgi:hypothetical protein
MAHNGLGQRRLQRRADEQQHGRSIRLRRQHYRDIYLYEYLCTADDDLSSYLHGGGTTNRSIDLPDQHHGSGLPDTSGGQYGICSMARNGLGQWRLQRCSHQQQYGSA